FVFELLKKARIDKLLWLCGFRLWHLRCEHLENELDSFDREERLFGNRFYIVVPGSFEDFGIVDAHVLGENFLRCLPVGVDKMDSLEVSLHRRLDSLAIALDVCARASEAVALHFDAKICDLQKIDEAHLSCDGRGGQLKSAASIFPATIAPSRSASGPPGTSA